MAVEIEYRFLVESDDWRADSDGARTTKIEQGYVFDAEHGNMRIRIVDDTDAVVTVKGARDGAARPEYEWPIDLDEARAMIADLCPRPPMVKTRWHLAGDTAGWTVDVFEGENAGLIIAEREVESITEQFTRPGWLEREVTSDRAYSNASLQFTPQPRLERIYAEQNTQTEADSCRTC